jgi:hypothetical protein
MSTKLEWMEAIASEAVQELNRASDKFGRFASSHEGYAVILEELDELWEEVRKQYDVRSNERMRKEAIQVAAMAMRFVFDICDGGRGYMKEDRDA